MTYRALMSLDTVLKCSVAVTWVCRVVTAKVTFVRAPQTHVIRRCAVHNLRPAGRLATVATYMWLPCSSSKQGYHDTDAASIATFPRHLMVEYGVPAGDYEVSTVVARSQAVPRGTGWSTA